MCIERVAQIRGPVRLIICAAHRKARRQSVSCIYPRLKINAFTRRNSSEAVETAVVSIEIIQILNSAARDNFQSFQRRKPRLGKLGHEKLVAPAMRRDETARMDRREEVVHMILARN